MWPIPEWVVPGLRRMTIARAYQSCTDPESFVRGGGGGGGGEG